MRGLSLCVQVALVLLVFLSCHATAAILVTGGDVVVVSAPADTRIGRLESNTEIKLFFERLGYELPVDVQLDITLPSTVPVPDNQTPGVLPAGSMVNSYMAHFDPVGKPAGTGVDVEGSVTFDEMVLGIIGRSPSLLQTDFVLGNPSTIYPRGSHKVMRRIEFDPGDAGPATRDTVSLSSNRRTVGLDLHSGHSLDQARIVTAAVTASWGTFQNLDFEEAVIDGPPYYVTDALPHWTANGVFDPEMAYNTICIDSVCVSIHDSSSIYFGGPIQGQYTVLLQAGVDSNDPQYPMVDALIAQVGQLPGDAHSVMLQTDRWGSVSVLLDDVEIPLTEVGRIGDVSTWTGDVSAFAGLTAELKIEGHAMVDSISFWPVLFNAQLVPEPAACTLLALGCLVLLRRRLRLRDAARR